MSGGRRALGPLAVSVDASAVPEQPVGAGRYTLELVRALSRRSDVALTVWCRLGDRERWEALSGARGRGSTCASEGAPGSDPSEVPDPGSDLDPSEVLDPGSDPTPGVRAARGSIPRRAPGATSRSVAPVVFERAPRARPARLAWEQLGLPSDLRRAGVEVHHGPHYTMPWRCPVPAVVTVHDLTFVDHPEWHERAKVLVFRRAIALARRRATAVVCVSEFTARRLEATGGAQGRVFVVPHGVDHDRFRPDEPRPGADARALAALGVEPPYVLFLGTIEPRKAVTDLLRAFDAVAEDEPALRLVLAGAPGWGIDQVDQVLASLAHRDRVLRTGYVSEAAVPALLRRAAAVCYPALEEGFGLPALEAVACGVPLVTTAGSVMAELVGTAAIVVEPGSVPALAEALRESRRGGPKAAQRRAAGLAVARAHTWEACAAGHVAAYRFAAGREEQAENCPGTWRAGR